MELINDINQCLYEASLKKKVLANGMSIEIHSGYDNLRRLLGTTLDQKYSNPTVMTPVTYRNVMTLRSMLVSERFKRWVPYLVLFANRDWYFYSRTRFRDMKTLVMFLIPGYSECTLDRFICDVKITPNPLKMNVYAVRLGVKSDVDILLPKSIAMVAEPYSDFNVIGIMESESPVQLLEEACRFDRTLFLEVAQHLIEGDERYPHVTEKFLVSEYLTVYGHVISSFEFFHMNLLKDAAKALLGFDYHKDDQASKEQLKQLAMKLPEFEKYDLKLKRDECICFIKRMANHYVQLLLQKRAALDQPALMERNLDIINYASSIGLYKTHSDILRCLGSKTHYLLGRS